MPISSLTGGCAVATSTTPAVAVNGTPGEYQRTPTPAVPSLVACHRTLHPSTGAAASRRGTLHCRLLSGRRPAAAPSRRRKRPRVVVFSDPPENGPPALLCSSSPPDRHQFPKATSGRGCRLHGRTDAHPCARGAMLALPLVDSAPQFQVAPPRSPVAPPFSSPNAFIPRLPAPIFARFCRLRRIFTITPL